jgi:hypothetical protein
MASNGNGFSSSSSYASSIHARVSTPKNATGNKIDLAWQYVVLLDAE